MDNYDTVRYLSVRNQRQIELNFRLISLFLDFLVSQSKFQQFYLS